MRIDHNRFGLDKLTPVQSRALAIVLTLIALAVAYFLFLHWWFVAPLVRVESEMHDLRAVHAKYAAAIAQQPLLEKRVAKLQRGGATAGAFLSGTDASAAAASLIQRATNVVAAHANQGAGCSMPAKMPIEQDNLNQRFRRVSVSITLNCGIQPLAAVLHDFNRGLPYLFVDDMTLARGSSGRMQAQLTLSGYLQVAAR